MNRTKVVKAISMSRAVKAGKIPGHAYSSDSEMDYLYNAVEALEEIASEENTETLRVAISILSGQHHGNLTEELAKLRSLLTSIQVPKEVMYAYPVTLQRHFEHYCELWVKCAPVVIPVNLAAKETDAFGCDWQRFTGPKELVDYLRQCNVPIKVCK